MQIDQNQLTHTALVVWILVLGCINVLLLRSNLLLVIDQSEIVFIQN